MMSNQRVLYREMIGLQLSLVFFKKMLILTKINFKMYMLCFGKEAGYFMNYVRNKCAIKYIHVLIYNLVDLNLNHYSYNIF